MFVEMGGGAMNDRERAVAAKLEAEAEKARAEARKAHAEALDRERSAELTAIELERERRKAREEMASDRQNRTYVFGTSVNEASVKACMDTLSTWHRLEPGCEMTIVLNSPGGDVIEGMALFDHILWLREQGHRVVMIVRGMAASMAGILLQSASHRIVGREAWVLIHRAAFGAIGKSFEVEDRVE